MANVNKISEKAFTAIKTILADNLARIREFALPEEGEFYTFTGVKEVTLPNREEPYKAVKAKNSAGIEVTFWPSWLYSNIVDIDGVRHVSTLDGEPLNEVGDDFPQTVKCESIESFNAIRNVYTDGVVSGTMTKTCTVYHWVSVEE